MRTLVGVALVAAGIAYPTAAFSQEPDATVVGSWEGPLAVQGTTLRIVFHLERAEDGTWSGTMDSPDQMAFGLPLTSVEVEGTDVTITVAGAGITYAGSLAETGDAIAGTFSQGPMNLELELVRSDATDEPPVRPQEPTAPFPYDVSDVTFPNAEAGLELAGTITMPRGEGPFPGVVLVSGSGPQDRNEALMGHKPFLVLADHLTRNGIAVLRFDDRGVGESGGDFSMATSEDFTSDALAALTHLAEQPQVSADAVGIAGHSEGGLIAPMAAVRSDDVAFIVMLAGPGVPGIDILVAQGELINRAAMTPPAVIEMNRRIQQGLADIVAEEPDEETAAPKMRALMREEFDALPPEIRSAAGDALGDDAIEQTVSQMNTPWFRFFLHHDPRPDLAAVDVPVLSLIGSKDLQVPHELNNPEIEAAFARGGNDDATVRTLEGLNHLFQTATTGSPAEYQQIEETMNQAALEAVSSWILERFGPG